MSSNTKKKPGPTAARERAKALRREAMMTKRSVSIAERDWLWIEKEAERRGTSNSRVVQEALALYRRDQDLQALLEETGGTDDLSAENMHAILDAWRQAGLNV